MGIKVINLEDIPNSNKLQFYILQLLNEGKTIEVRPDKGPSYIFKRVSPNKFERKNITTSSIDIINDKLLFSHICHGTGEVEIMD